MLHDASARPPGQGQASATRHTYSSLRKAKAKQESGQDGDLDVERDRYSEQGKPNAVRVALRDMPVILPVRKHIENPDSASGLKGPGARTTGEKKHEFTLETRLRLDRMASENAVPYSEAQWELSSPSAVAALSLEDMATAFTHAKIELNNASTQIVALHHARYDLEDRITHLLRERQEDQGRLKTIGEWLTTLEGAVHTDTARDFALKLDQHLRKLMAAKREKTVSACFGGWDHLAREKRRERVRSTRFACRQDGRRLLAAFASWIHEADATQAWAHGEQAAQELQAMHDLVRKDVMSSAVRLVRKMRYGALARAFDSLAAHTQDQRQLKIKTIAMLRLRSHQRLTRAVLGWHGACRVDSLLRAQPLVLAVLLRHKRHTAQGQIVAAWRHYSRILQKQWPAVERILARNAHAQLAQTFHSWSSAWQQGMQHMSTAARHARRTRLSKALCVLGGYLAQRRRLAVSACKLVRHMLYRHVARAFQAFSAACSRGVFISQLMRRRSRQWVQGWQCAAFEEWRETVHASRVARMEAQQQEATALFTDKEQQARIEQLFLRIRRKRLLGTCIAELFQHSLLVRTFGIARVNHRLSVLLSSWWRWVGEERTRRKQLALLSWRGQAGLLRRCLVLFQGCSREKGLARKNANQCRASTRVFDAARRRRLMSVSINALSQHAQQSFFRTQMLKTTARAVLSSLHCCQISVMHAWWRWTVEQRRKRTGMTSLLLRIITKTLRVCMVQMRHGCDVQRCVRVKCERMVCGVVRKLADRSFVVWMRYSRVKRTLRVRFDRIAAPRSRRHMGMLLAEWHQAVKGARCLGAATWRLALHTQHRRAWATLRAWRECARTQLKVARAVFRWRRRSMLGAWSQWRKNAAAIHHQRCLLCSFLRRAENTQVAATFASWYDHAASFKRQTLALSRMLKRMMRTRVLASFRAWCCLSADRKSMRLAGRKAADRWLRCGILSTYRHWHAVAARMSEQRDEEAQRDDITHTMLKCIAHGRKYRAACYVSSAAAVSAWRSRLQQRRVLAVFEGKLVAWRTNEAASQCLAAWCERAWTTREKRAALRQFLVHWGHNRQRSVFADWHGSSVEGGNVRGMLRRSALAVSAASLSKWSALTSYQRYLRRRHAFVENRTHTAKLHMILRAWCGVQQQQRKIAQALVRWRMPGMSKAMQAWMEYVDITHDQRVQDANLEEQRRLIAAEQARARDALDREACHRMEMSQRLAQRLRRQQLSKAWARLVEHVDTSHIERAQTAQDWTWAQMQDAVLQAVTRQEKRCANFAALMLSRSRKTQTSEALRAWSLQAQVTARNRLAAASFLAQRTLFVAGAAMRCWREASATRRSTLREWACAHLLRARVAQTLARCSLSCMC